LLIPGYYKTLKFNKRKKKKQQSIIGSCFMKTEKSFGRTRIRSSNENAKEDTSNQKVIHKRERERERERERKRERERAYRNDRVAKADLREEKREPTPKSTQTGRTSHIAERIYVQEEYPFLACLLLLSLRQQLAANCSIKSPRNGSRSSDSTNPPYFHFRCFPFSRYRCFQLGSPIRGRNGW
jgi:hypothetical protein